MMRAKIAATVGAAQSLAQQAQTAAADRTSAAATMTTLTHAARDEVNSVTAGMKDFDRYLQFGPGDTEEAYRQREAERRAYIEAQQAKNTPEGDLNASGAAVGQMVDAKAHGAGDSPEFEQRWDKLVATTEALRSEIIRQGGSTKEFDDRLREDLRRTLKAKGLSDAEIDARFAANPDNPLEAAKAFVKEADLDMLAPAVSRAGTREAPSDSATIEAPPVPSDNAADAIAALRASGIVLADHQTSEDFEHGVSSPTVQRPAAGRNS